MESLQRNTDFCSFNHMGKRVTHISIPMNVNIPPPKMSNKPVLLQQYEHFITHIHQFCTTLIFVWNLRRYWVNSTVDMLENIKITIWPNKSNYRISYLESIYFISLEPNKNIKHHTSQKKNMFWEKAMNSGCFKTSLLKYNPTNNKTFVYTGIHIYNF